MTKSGTPTRGTNYSLAIDLGTSFVAAAVARGDQVKMVALGDRSVVMPSVVYAREDGALMTGDSAGRRVVSNPDRVASEVKRRLGDPTPVMLGGAAYSVTDLLGTLLKDVLDRVAEEQGGRPERLMLTHPANWGPHQKELFAQAARVAGAENWRTVTEPEAAAAHYAATRHLEVGEVIAVYDLGGGTFDATVLGRTEHGIEVLGSPRGIERLGGADLDDAILSFVNHAAGGALAAQDLGSPSTVVAMARLRQDCVQAKEALSLDTEVTIPVFLPGRHLEVELSRRQFEDLIRVQVESTIGALSRALHSASMTPDRLSAVLLVGGSSQIPLVARMIEEQLGCRTVVDAHPKHAVALGAAALVESTRAADSRARLLQLARDNAQAGKGRDAVPAPAPAGSTVGRAAASDLVFPPLPTEAPEEIAGQKSRPRRRVLTVAAGLLVLAGAGTGLGVSLSQAGTPSQHVQAAGLPPAGTTTPSGATPSTPAVTTRSVVLPTDLPGLISAVTANQALAGTQTQALVAQLDAARAGVGEARREAALGALGIVKGAGIQAPLASAVTTALTPFTVLDTPAQMIADLKPNVALGGRNAFRVLGCMQEFRGHPQQLQQRESQEILRFLPTWSANGGVRADLVAATIRIVTPVANGQKAFSAVEAG
jgi:actin-like ATPase involved in cell morphogenesis